METQLSQSTISTTAVPTPVVHISPCFEGVNSLTKREQVRTKMISGRGWIRVEPWYGLLCCGQDGSEDQSGVGGGDCMEREEMQVSVVIALHVLAYLTLWNKLVKCASQN